MSYQVFIDGAAIPGNEAGVAGAIGQRFGLPVDALLTRLGKGRFRVKKDVDLATARSFARQLGELGAVAVVIGPDGDVVPDESSGAEDFELTLAPAGAPPRVGGTFGPRAPGPLGAIGSREAVPPAAASPLAGIGRQSSAVQEESGLAAALRGGGVAQDLGALGSDAGMSLAALDGAEQPPPAAGGDAADFAPPGDDAAFLPPDALAEAALEVDAPVRPPAPEVPHIAPAEELASSADAAEEPTETPQGSFLARLWRVLNEDTRTRFAFGIVAVTLLAAVPMHVYASMSEDSAYGEMKAELAKRQALVEDPDEWDRFMEFRTTVSQRMDRARAHIAVTGCLLWLVLGGGLGFVYFRKLPWDDRGPRLARSPGT